MGKVKKTAKKTTTSKTGIVKKGMGAISSLIGKGGAKKGSVRRGSRRKSPEYWAKKVLVEKLKKKYFKIKYGGK